MTLVPIIDLFHEDFMQHDNELKDMDYKTAREWIIPLFENYCENMKAELGIEYCNPNDVKRCGYNDNCNPANEDCMQTAVNDYKCITKVTKIYVNSLVSSAMDEIKTEMKAEDVAKLIEDTVGGKLHGFELYVSVLAG